MEDKNISPLKDQEVGTMSNRDPTIYVAGSVYGTVAGTDPAPSTTQGRSGIEGGEDVEAYADGFRSLREAANWCEDVIAGRIHAHIDHPRNLCDEHGPVTWSWARVDDFDFEVTFRLDPGETQWRQEEDRGGIS